MSLATLALRPKDGPAAACWAGAAAAVVDDAGLGPPAGLARKGSRSSVSNSRWVTTESGTLKVTTTPPLPFTSSSSKAASVTCTLPPAEAMRPLRLSRVSLLAGISETSTSSHFKGSRNFGPTWLHSQVTVGLPGSAHTVYLV